MATIGNVARVTGLEDGSPPRRFVLLAFFFFAERGMNDSQELAISIESRDETVNLGPGRPSRASVDSRHYKQNKR